LLDDELRNDPSTYPPQEILQKLVAGMLLDIEAQKMRERLWREVRG